MRCTICCAVFGLLVSTGTVFPQAHAARSFARPTVRVVSVRWFAPRPVVFLPYCYPVSFPYPCRILSVSCLEFHFAIARIRVCRQRLAFPPADWC